MSNYMNGYSYPVVIVKDISSDATIEEIELDMCGAAGMTEEYEETFKRNELEKQRKIVDYNFEGSRITFVLDYSEYVRKANLTAIETILAYNSQPETYYLVLRPRADILGREFEVRCEGNYSLGIMKGGARAPGNRLPVIRFTTVYSQSKNFVDPDTVAVPRHYF